MSVYWNTRTRELSPYIPGEQPKDRKFIKLNTNENPYPPSPLVIEAIQKAANETLRLYPDPTCTELREAVAKRYGISASQVFAGNGSDEVLAFAFAAFFETAPNGNKNAQAAGQPGIVFPDITYSFYPVYADLWNAAYKTIPLKEDFSIDVAAYINLSLSAKPGGIILSNPNAPTGIALSIEEVKKIAEAAEHCKYVLIVDEAYIAFAETDASKQTSQSLKTYGSMLPYIDEFPNLLIIRTLSKESSLAGLRAGFAIGSEELIEGLCRIRDSFNSYTLDRLALAGAAAAIKDFAYYDEINSRIINTRRRVSSGLKALGWRGLPSQANFIFAAPPADCGKSGSEFFTALREHGILVRHFNKPRIADFLRISIGSDPDMDVFLASCREILQNSSRKGTKTQREKNKK